MNDLDKALAGLTNEIAQINIQAATEMQRALEEYHRQLFWHNLLWWTSGIFTTIVIVRVWNWLRNTEAHLKKISDAAHQSDAAKAYPKKSNDEYSGVNSPTAKPSSRPIPSPHHLQPSAKEQSGPVDSSVSVHPDSRYMPKN